MCRRDCRRDEHPREYRKASSRYADPVRLPGHPESRGSLRVLDVPGSGTFTALSSGECGALIQRVFHGATGERSGTVPKAPAEQL